MENPKLQAQKEQTKQLEGLHDKLEESDKQQELFQAICGDLTDEEKKESIQFAHISAEKFDQGEDGFRKYEKNGQHMKAARCIMYYIVHQRKDNNMNWPYNDLLYRHVAQNLLQANEFDKAAKILETTKTMSISGERKAIDDITFDALIAFTYHDVGTLEKLHKDGGYDSLDDFNKKTLDAMIVLGRQGIWDYTRAYGGRL